MSDQGRYHRWESILDEEGCHGINEVDVTAEVDLLRRERDEAQEALRLVQWGTESLCAACWPAGDDENGEPYGVEPLHTPDCPVRAALGERAGT